MIEIKVDFSRVCGKIKPLHGFNNSSRKTDYGDVLPDFLTLHPPIVRLHDTGGKYGGSHYVDIPNIFPDFSADADNPANYDFTLTDCYIKPLIEAGIRIMYRLGVTIEHEPKKYNIYPPSDPYKWANICEHIIRHYNCGWADGYFWNIEFWEIWNEPDGIDPNVEPNGPPNWLGTAKQYYELYSITANHLKALHPHIKVGGYSSCYILGANINGKWTPGPYDFFTDFLEYISSPATKAPLDFFTWHGYLSLQQLEKIEIESNFVNEILNRYGFTDTLRIDAEWNCCICDKDTAEYRNVYYINMRNNKGASHVAAALFEMQRLNVDYAMFYDAQLWCEYGCLFNVPSLTPSKSYYSFLLFNDLFRLGSWCYSESKENIYTLAAKAQNEMLAIANINDVPKKIRLDIKNCNNIHAQIYTIDECSEYTLAGCCEMGDITDIELPAYSVITILFK